MQFLDTKLKDIRAVKKGEKSKSQIARDFGVPANGWRIKRASTIKPREKPENKFIQRRWIRNTEMVEAAREKNPISGPMLVTKSEEYARKLDKTDFKTSNGW